MVLTRSGKNKTTTKKTDAETTSSSASGNYVEEADEAEKQLEDLKLVASLVDWSHYDGMMGKIFYETFGRKLEETLDKFEKTKAELKECIRRNCDNPKLLQTPQRKIKPEVALREQIRKIEQLNLDSNEEINVTTQTMKEVSPIQMPPLLQWASPKKLLDTTTQKQQKLGEIGEKAVQAQKKEEEQLKEKAEHDEMDAITQSTKKVPPIQMPPLLQLPSTPKKLLDTTIQKQQKLREIDEKAIQAQKKKEEQLKEKAERAKKQREERLKLVEQNNRQLEQERREKMAQARQHEIRVKEFVNEQKKVQQLPRSPLIAPTAAKKQRQQLPQSPLIPPTAAKKQRQQLAQSPLVVSTAPKKQQHHFEPKKQIDIKDQENHPPPNIIKQKPPTPQLSPILPDAASELEEVSAYDITKEKVFLPSTEENYNVDDLSSADETDNDEQPRKTVPKWAQKENLVERIKAIRRLVPPERIERYFGKIEQPTVGKFFSGYQKNYPQRRLSSAVWDSPMSDPTPGTSRYQNQFEPP